MQWCEISANRPIADNMTTKLSIDTEASWLVFPYHIKPAWHKESCISNKKIPNRINDSVYSLAW